MRAFLFYIDDWLASKQIARMDAAEERGYLRLLLHAATEDDCGLPTDDHELASISLLGKQWFMPTADRSKRFGKQTSGQKLLACFFEKDGRLYNKRLLKEFEHQKEVSSKRSSAGKKANEIRWGKHSDTDRMPDGSQTDPNGVCVCACDSVSDSVSETTENASTENVSEFNLRNAWKRLWEAYPRGGRIRELKANVVFLDIFSDRSPPEQEQLFEQVMAGLEIWKQSSQWTRGIVNHIANWLEERLWQDHPLSAKEAAAQAARQNGQASRMPDLYE